MKRSRPMLMHDEAVKTKTKVGIFFPVVFSVLNFSFNASFKGET